MYHLYWPDCVYLKRDGGSTLNTLICSSILKILHIFNLTGCDKAYWLTRNFGTRWPSEELSYPGLHYLDVRRSRISLEEAVHIRCHCLARHDRSTNLDPSNKHCISVSITSKNGQCSCFASFPVVFQSSQSNNNNVKWSAALDSERENLRGTISQLIVKCYCKTEKTTKLRSPLI